MLPLNFLRIPESLGIANLDAPETAITHRKIIQSKPFLRRLYRDLYLEIGSCLPKKNSLRIIEIGSGEIGRAHV